MRKQPRDCYGGEKMSTTGRRVDRMGERKVWGRGVETADFGGCRGKCSSEGRKKEGI